MGGNTRRDEGEKMEKLHNCLSGVMRLMWRGRQETIPSVILTGLVRLSARPPGPVGLLGNFCQSDFELSPSPSHVYNCILLIGVRVCAPIVTDDIFPPDGLHSPTSALKAGEIQRK